MYKTALSDLLNSDPAKTVAHIFKKIRNKFALNLLIEKNIFLQNCTINQKRNDNIFFKNLRIYRIVKFFQLQRITLNILNEYRRKKKIKRRLAARRAFIIRIGKANHAHQRAHYETEKAILDQRLKEAIAALETINAIDAQKPCGHAKIVSSRQNQMPSVPLAADISALEHNARFYRPF
jgi:hypothetical protein